MFWIIHKKINKIISSYNIHRVHICWVTVFANTKSFYIIRLVFLNYTRIKETRFHVLLLAAMVYLHLDNSEASPPDQSGAKILASWLHRWRHYFHKANEVVTKSDGTQCAMLHNYVPAEIHINSLLELYNS